MIELVPSQREGTFISYSALLYSQSNQLYSQGADNGNPSIFSDFDSTILKDATTSIENNLKINPGLITVPWLFTESVTSGSNCSCYTKRFECADAALVKNIGTRNIDYTYVIGAYVPFMANSNAMSGTTYPAPSTTGPLTQFITGKNVVSSINSINQSLTINQNMLQISSRININPIYRSLAIYYNPTHKTTKTEIIKVSNAHTCTNITLSIDEEERPIHYSDSFSIDLDKTNEILHELSNGTAYDSLLTRNPFKLIRYSHLYTL